MGTHPAVIRRAFGFTHSGIPLQKRRATRLNAAQQSARRRLRRRHHHPRLSGMQGPAARWRRTLSCCYSAPWVFLALRGCFLLSAVYVYVYEWMSVEPPPRLLWCWCGGVVFSRCRAVLVKALLFPELGCGGPVPSSCLSCFPRSTSLACVCVGALASFFLSHPRFVPLLPPLPCPPSGLRVSGEPFFMRRHC